MFRLILFLLLLAPVSPGASMAEEFEAGVAAYEAGDLEAAEAIWAPLAEGGHRMALYALGKLYDSGGPGWVPDPERAAEWYRRAAAAGSADARNNLAMLLVEGRGVERDEAAAVELWRRAADSGHPQAQYNLAMAHYSGLGVERQLEAAAEWFRRAADNRLPQAQFALAELYRLGIGVPRDEALAAAWYERARGSGYGSERVKEKEDASAAPADTALSDSGRLPPAQAVDPSKAEPALIPESPAASVGPVLSDTPLILAPAPSQTAMAEASEGATIAAPGAKQSALQPPERPPLPASAVPPPQPAAPAVDEDRNPVSPPATPEVEAGLPSEQLEPPAANPASATGADAPEAVVALEAEVQDSAAGPVGLEGDGAVAALPAAAPRKPVPDPDSTTAVPAADAAETEVPGGQAPELPFGLWLGSMQSRQGAERLWQEARQAYPEELSHREAVFVPVVAQGRQFLRVVGVGYASRDEAEAACRRLRARHHETFCNVLRTE